jgi:hypothetical protein
MPTWYVWGKWWNSYHYPESRVNVHHSPLPLPGITILQSFHTLTWFGSFWKPIHLYSVDTCFKLLYSQGGVFKAYLPNTDLSMKEGRLFVLFCSYEIHWTGMLQIVFLVSLGSSQWGGVQGLGSMMFGLVVQKLLNIEWFLHWKVN